jgi:hypothetical protein
MFDFYIGWFLRKCTGFLGICTGFLRFVLAFKVNEKYEKFKDFFENGFAF